MSIGTRINVKLSVYKNKILLYSKSPKYCMKPVPKTNTYYLTTKKKKIHIII